MRRSAGVLGLVTVVRIFDLGFHEALHRPFNPVNDWRLLPPAVDMVRESFGPGWADAAVVGAVLVVVLVPVAVTCPWSGSAGPRRTDVGSRPAPPARSASCGWSARSLGVQLTPGVPVASRGAAAGRRAGPRRGPQPGGSVGVRGRWRPTTPGARCRRRSCSPGCAARTCSSSSSRATGGWPSRGPRSRRPSGSARRRHGDARDGGVLLPQRVPDVVDVRRDQLAGPRHAALRPVGGQPAALRPAAPQRPLHAFRGVRAGRLADRSRRAVEPGPLAGGQASTASTWTTTGPTSGTRAPSSASRRSRTSTRWRPSSAWSWHRVMRRSWRRSTWCPRTNRGPRCLACSTGTSWGTAPSTTACPAGPTPADVVGDAGRLETSFGQSIEYALTSLISFVTTFHEQDDDLVLVCSAIISRPPSSPGRRLARRPDHDHRPGPAVLERTSAWGWDDGMLPRPDAPVWRMDAFRNRFLTPSGPRRPQAPLQASARRADRRVRRPDVPERPTWRDLVEIP